MNSEEGCLIDMGDTSLYVVERGQAYPLNNLPEGPGFVALQHAWEIQ